MQQFDRDNPDDVFEAVWGLQNLVMQTLSLGLSWYHYIYNSTNPAETQFWSVTYYFLSTLGSFSFVLTVFTAAYFVGSVCELPCTSKRRIPRDRIDMISIGNGGLGLALDIIYFVELILENMHTVVGLFPKPALQWMIIVTVLRIMSALFRPRVGQGPGKRLT